MNAWWGNLAIHEGEGAFSKWQNMHHERFKRHGLPDKKHESWRYLPFQQLAALQYSSKPHHPVFYNCPIKLEHAVVIQCQGDAFQVLHGDIFGLEILSLADAFALYPEQCEAYMAEQTLLQDGFSDLNAANLHTGLWLKLKQGQHLKGPVIIHHQAQAGVMSHFRHLCVLEPNSSMQLIEYFDSKTDKTGFINHVSALFVGEYADLQHYRIQDLGIHDNLQSSVLVWQEQYSSYHDFLLQLGGKIASCDLRVHAQAAYTKAFLAGIFQTKHQQFHQQRVNVVHAKEHGHSEQLYRGVLDDRAKGVFIGEVYVAPHAIKTEAHQSNKNLLLAPQAEMITCPQLQIFADDVVCSHGATVGQLAEDAIFYLQTRGIAEDAAKAFLTKAFYHEPLMAIHVEALREWCLARLAQRG